ncbi:unnamed protein product, partial [Heterosigma akashiwo]
MRWKTQNAALVVEHVSDVWIPRKELIAILRGYNMRSKIICREPWQLNFNPCVIPFFLVFSSSVHGIRLLQSLSRIFLSFNAKFIFHSLKMEEQHVCCCSLD